jgi:hypothetical protein
MLQKEHKVGKVVDELVLLDPLGWQAAMKEVCAFLGEEYLPGLGPTPQIKSETPAPKLTRLAAVKKLTKYVRLLSTSKKLTKYVHLRSMPGSLHICDKYNWDYKFVVLIGGRFIPEKQVGSLYTDGKGRWCSHLPEEDPVIKKMSRGIDKDFYMPKRFAWDMRDSLNRLIADTKYSSKKYIIQLPSVPYT